MIKKFNNKMLGVFESDTKLLVVSVIFAFFLFTTFYSVKVFATGETPTLSVAVQSSITTVISTDNFANLTPGTPVWATSTISVTTNNSSGWNVTFSGNNVSGNDTEETAQALNDGGSNEITDLDPQWTAGAATTSAGTATTISSGDDVLAFRVMSASGTAVFLSTDWWGSDDTPFTNALWAGIASSTNVSQIGNSSVSSGGSAALNTVQYYLDVSTTQETGTYTGIVTFTVTAN